MPEVASSGRDWGGRKVSNTVWDTKQPAKRLNRLWLARYVYVDINQPEHPTLLWHGRRRPVAKRTLAALLHLRAHAGQWLKIWDILVAVDGPNPTTSPDAMSTNLGGLLSISDIASHLHHLRGGLWCWIAVPRQLTPD